ncbi:ArnT family glycosyltransferase [Dokdonella sp. MW10]|uniref:ArnT family glycosyltransferase n=1 Tax=Dokdonella sp. MW10 TaxID=2992926 RepID=UPI003F7F053C
MPAWTLAALVAIFQTGPMPLYSTRTLGVAWEMWQAGQFLVPYANGEPYSHKVPLLFWLIHAGWAVGGVGDVWPRLLEVGIGLGVLVLAARLARKLFRDDPGVEALAPWILAAFGYAFLFALQIMYEMLLCLCVLGALVALAGDRENRPRFGWFAVAVAAGLMTKGPVMLLHVAFPFLLGPFWSAWASHHRAAWYGRGALALVAAMAVLLAWAIPASMAGGEVYRHELFFMQTAGRVVDSFDHARPWWWYAQMLPALLVPWLLWPRAWQAAVAGLSRPRGTGLRFIACWLVPIAIAFSLVSGKQLYYLLPEAAGGAMLLALGLSRVGARGAPAPWWLGPWPLALVLLAGAAALAWLPGGVASGEVTSVWYIDLAPAAPAFALGCLGLGLALLACPRGDAAAARRIAVVSMAGLALVYVVFAQTLWPRFDLAPAAARIAAMQAAGTQVVHHDIYHNQFQFLGRLEKPLEVLPLHGHEPWLDAHPEARVIHYVETLTAADLANAEFVQPFRSDWLLIERAGTWGARLRGAPQPPAQPAQRHPEGYWPFRAVDAAHAPAP